MLRAAAASGNTFYVIPPGTSTLLQLPPAAVTDPQVEKTPPAEAAATPAE